MEAPQDQAHNAEEEKDMHGSEEEFEEDPDYTDEAKEADIKLISALEEYCSLPVFTDAIQQIMADHSHKFTTNEEEQNLEWYGIYKDYIKTVEELLQKFLEENSVTEEDLYSWWNRINQYSTDALSWIDYLLATSEYTEFCNMMVEYKDANSWNVTDQQDDFLSSILNMKMEPPKKNTKRDE